MWAEQFTSNGDTLDLIELLANGPSVTVLSRQKIVFNFLSFKKKLIPKNSFHRRFKKMYSGSFMSEKESSGQITPIYCFSHHVRDTKVNTYFDHIACYHTGQS